MMKINDNCFYRYSMLSRFEQTLYYEKIYLFLKSLAWEYPGFKQWYNSLFTRCGSLKSEREILICEKDFRIAGVAILKWDEDEKKICTLRVAKEFQKQGIGKRLMELSFEWLQSDRPLITMHKTKQREFSALLKYYGFELEQQQKNYYHVFNTEFVYNGVLPRKKTIIEQIRLLNIEEVYEEFISSGKYDFNAFLNEYVTDWLGKKKYITY